MVLHQLHHQKRASATDTGEVPPVNYTNILSRYCSNVNHCLRKSRHWTANQV